MVVPPVIYISIGAFVVLILFWCAFIRNINKKSYPSRSRNYATSSGPYCTTTTAPRRSSDDNVGCFGIADDSCIGGESNDNVTANYGGGEISGRIRDDCCVEENSGGKDNGDTGENCCPVSVGDSCVASSGGDCGDYSGGDCGDYGGGDGGGCCDD